MKGSAWIWIVVAALAGNALAYGAYVTLRGAPATPSAPLPIAESDEVRVEFSSIPPGATVVEGDEPLGVTPFVRIFTATDREAIRHFIFSAKGYQSVEVQRPLDRPRLKIVGRLDVEDVAEAAPGRSASPSRDVDEPVVRRTASRGGGGRTEKVPRLPSLTEREPATAGAGRVEAVPRLGGAEATVPKLGGEGEAVPRLSAPTAEVPRLGDQENDGEVPKLDGVAKVPKLGSEGAVPKVGAERPVPKVD